LRGKGERHVKARKDDVVDPIVAQRLQAQPRLAASSSEQLNRTFDVALFGLLTEYYLFNDDPGALVMSDLFPSSLDEINTSALAKERLSNGVDPLHGSDFELQWQVVVQNLKK
jgi:hypothetical protein